MKNLDGKIEKGISHFLLGDKFFVSLSDYKRKDNNFVDTVHKNLPAEWEKHEAGIWHHIVPPTESNKLQGFKIHVSTKPAKSTKLLKIVSKVCLDNYTQFKFLCDSKILQYFLSKNCTRTSSGKFIVIYPNSFAQFKYLLEKLYQLTDNFEGPFILSDNIYRDSKVLHYRYGAFKKITKIDIRGEQTSFIKDPQGNLTPDVKKPYYQLPSWVSEPFRNKEREQDADDKILLDERFQISEVLQYSNVGGVYKAKDQTSQENVIIKEARKNVRYAGLGDANFDATEILRKEYSILEALEDLNYTPNPCSIYQQWKHWFIAMDEINGIKLVTLRARSSFNPYLRSESPSKKEKVAFFRKVLNLFGEIITKIYKIHTRGVIVGDISPENIIYDDDKDKISIIDFESAFSEGSKYGALRMGTPGYYENLNGVADYNSDYYSLGLILLSMLHPINPILDIKNDMINQIFRYLTDKRGVPKGIINIIDFLTNNDYRCPEEIFQQSLLKVKKAKKSLATKNIRTPTKTTIQEKNIEPKIEKISTAILSFASPEKMNCLFPADCRIYSTNPLSLSHGALGILASLDYMGHKILPRHLNWVLNKDINQRRYPPGLYIGCAGMAYSFFELGFTAMGEKCMKLSNQSDLKYKSADIYYGSAGIGLINLFFYKKTHKKHYLNEAYKCAKSIKNMAAKTSEGFMFYKNIDNFISHGFAYGATGISFFFMKLYEITNEDEYNLLAQSFIEYDLSQAYDFGEGLKWTHTKNSNNYTPYWTRGSSGIGSILIRFYELTGNKKYKTIATKIAHAQKGKDAKWPGQFLGNAGIGEFYLDMYKITEEERYKEEAMRIAETMSLYEIQGEHGILYSGERLLRLSTDFGTGSAGVGVFLKRLITNKDRMIYDF